MSLEERVAQLEAALAAMKKELRTERVVVVDETGEERVHVEVDDGQAVLGLMSPGWNDDNGDLPSIFFTVSEEDAWSNVTHAKAP